MTQTFLFTFNPKKSPLDSFEAEYQEFVTHGTVRTGWSCNSYKTATVGDRFFLTKLGTTSNGLFASGIIVSMPYPDEHWLGTGKKAYYVDIEIDTFSHYNNVLISNEFLKANFPNQEWSPQPCGIRIKPDVAEKLEEVWAIRTLKNAAQTAPSTEEELQEQTYIEGLAKEAKATRYERSTQARAECIRLFGYSCVVCGFDFEKKYGDVGKEFIHIHHIHPIADCAAPREVVPTRDLRPVCPNCHAMLHRGNTPPTIEELVALIVHHVN